MLYWDQNISFVSLCPYLVVMWTGSNVSASAIHYIRALIIVLVGSLSKKKVTIIKDKR